MYANEKEIEALAGALDFIASNADGSDEDKYPHDIMDGLRTLFAKAKKCRDKKHFKYLVSKALKKLQNESV